MMIFGTNMIVKEAIRIEEVENIAIIKRSRKGMLEMEDTRLR